MANLIGAAYKWRIDNNVYSYITNTDGGEPFIVSGSTECNEELIRNKVQNFTKEQYKTKFQEMVSAVHEYNNGKYSYVQFLDYTIYMNESEHCDIYNRPDVVTDIDFTVCSTTLPSDSEATVGIYTTDEDIECREGEKIRKYHIDFGIPKGSRFIPITVTDEELLQNGEQIIRDNDIIAGDFVVSVDSTTIWSCGNNYQFINSGVQLNKIDAKYRYFADINAYSFGEGDVAQGINSITEGYKTVATGKASHAEGSNTLSAGDYSHAEGASSESIGHNSHAEGNGSKSIGHNSHAEGTRTIANNNQSHSEGYETKSMANGAHAEGDSTIAYGKYSHAEGANSVTGYESIKPTTNNIVIPSNTDDEIGGYAHAEGAATLAIGKASHSEGNKTFSSGDYSHAEGYESHAEGDGSHAEGNVTHAEGIASHAEGSYSHAEGYASHAEGQVSYAEGNSSHVEGFGNIAYGDFSHVEGKGNIAKNEGQHVSGTYAEIDETNNAIFQVGIGTGDSTRKDAFRINKDGSFVFSVPENIDAPIFTFYPSIEQQEASAINEEEGEGGSVQTYNMRRSTARQTSIPLTTSNFIDLINLQNKINDAINEIDFKISQEDLDKLKEELSKDFEGIVDGEENDYNEIIAEILSRTTDLESQLDGEATAWFLKGEPTLNNEPAKDWNEGGTDGKESYASHEGDTYTDITEKEDGSIGSSWRWCRGDASGDTVGWNWHEISDSRIIRALYDASRAQSTADGKSTVYISKDEDGNRVPDHYQAGDMWIINNIALQHGGFKTENDIYYTQENGQKGTPISVGEMLTANANSKEYNVEHWSKEIKYTDDSYAIEAKNRADEAYEYADSGHTNALKAIELLNGISSDGRVYPNEFKELTLKKQTIYSEMIELVGESGNTGEASLWETGVDTADEYYTAAQSAISTLEYYTDENNFVIDAKTQKSLGYIQILNSDENKSHAGYWGNITNYYFRRQELLNDIADASKQYADNIEGIAEQAANAADSAKETADNAAQSASTALGMLNDVDNDNVVSITEFAALESELEVIERDLSGITNSIELYKNSRFYESLTQFTAEYEILSGSTVSYSGLKTYKIAQKKAVNALKYHCGQTATEGGFNVTAGEKDKNEHGSIIIRTSEHGNVISEPFEIDYQNIVKYYDVRQSILEHIAFVAKLYTESLQTELSPENVEAILRQIKIDGVNLVNGSRCNFEMKKWESTEKLTTQSEVDNEYTQTQINEESNLSFCTDLLDKITNKQWEGEYVSVSMEILIPKDNITEGDEQNHKKVNFGIVLRSGDVELFSEYTNDIECVYNDWTRLKLTFSMKNDITDVFTKDENDYLVTNVYLVVNDSDSNYKFQEGTTFKFRKIQIEFNTVCSSWYPSPEDINEVYSIAADAQQNANSAKEEAEASKNLLNDMSSDDKLTPQEKVNIRKEWGEIQEEYEQAQIDVRNTWEVHGFQLPNEYNEYESAYGYLGACLSLVHINSGETTDISEINGTIFDVEYTGREYFNKAFSTYYAKHVAFMNCLAEQLAYLEVRSMKIGGRNLLRNSKELIQSATTNDYTYTSFTPTVGLKPNTNYIFSVDKSEIIPNESSTGFTVYLFDDTIRNSRNRLTIPISNTRQIISFKTTSAVTDTDVLLIYVGIHGSTSNKTIKLTNFKLEEGDVATAWSMAPEDQMEYIEEIRDYADSIKTSLQNQIDGVVDSYFMEGEPTISNKPAIDWVETATENNKDTYAHHEGDTYTDISEITLLTSSMWEQGGIKWAATPSDSGADIETDYQVRTKYIDIKGCLSLLRLSKEYSYIIFYYDKNKNCLKVDTITDRDSATITHHQILKTVSNNDVTHFRLRLSYPSTDNNNKKITVNNAADANAMINPTAGHSWRWCNTDDEYGTGWHWHKIADSDAIKALQAAAAAQDTADGKRRVFTDQPYTPYDKGDLWIKTDINNTGLNDTLYCHTGKATGDFDSSHWSSSTAAMDAYNKAESAITSVDYLTEVMQSGTTEINGGLILTNVLALRNTDNTTVTGGMSGVINDNVLLWGGGTYEDAGNAAKTDYLKKDGTNKITTLIKKDGTGKIGAFYVDEDTIEVKPSNGMTVTITTKNIDEYSLGRNNGIITYEKSIGNKSSDGAKTYTEIIASMNIPLKESVRVSVGNINMEYELGSIGGILTPWVEATLNVIAKRIDGTSVASYNITMNDENPVIFSDNLVNRTITNKGDIINSAFAVEISLTVKYFCGIANVKFDYILTKESDTKRCVFARDGLVISTGLNQRFIIKPNTDALSIIADIPDLSTADTNEKKQAIVKSLEVGQLYTDSSGIVRRFSREDRKTYIDDNFYKGLEFESIYHILHPSASEKDYIILNGFYNIRGNFIDTE